MSEDDFLFHDLDDPGPPSPSADMLAHAVSRGRFIRRRRQSLSVLAAASVLAAIGGVAAVLNAQDSAGGQHDNVTVPLDSGTPTATASAAPGRHHPHNPGAISYGAGGYPAKVHRQHTSGGTTCVVATPQATDSPTPTDTPAVADSPATDVTDAPTPSATSAPDACASPTATPGATESPSAEPTDLPTDSPSPA